MLIEITSSYPKGKPYHTVQTVEHISQSTVIENHGTMMKKNRKGEFYENVLVHFDLKGAPPRVQYFLDLLKLIAKSGATGILLEWEDMFPWIGEIEIVRNTDAYSITDVKTILNEARKLNLDVIPLVQTFGHLEWLLKFEEFRKFRENDTYPQVLCLGDEDAVAIVKEALKQVIDVHKEYGIPFFHIGADEAFEFGVCEKSRKWIAEHGVDVGKQTLALTHLKKMANYVKDLVGNETVILVWHDMLKDFDSLIIKKLGLGELVEPVVWDYSENIVTMNDHSFSALATNFPVIWASSAYKGANFPSAKYSDVKHYEMNNIAWIMTKQSQQHKFKKFHGIIITGWQRYDHMAPICEILPIGTPSMVLNIQIAIHGVEQNQPLIRNMAATILGCTGFTVSNLDIISNNCHFPGFTLYVLLQGIVRQKIQRIESDLNLNHHIMGWLSPYNQKHNITQNWYLNQIKSVVVQMHNEIETIESEVREEMSKLFFDNTVEEFIYLTITPTADKLKHYLREIKRLSLIETYPKRHFKILRKEL